MKQICKCDRRPFSKLYYIEKLNLDYNNGLDKLISAKTNELPNIVTIGPLVKADVVFYPTLLIYSEFGLNFGSAF